MGREYRKVPVNSSDESPQDFSNSRFQLGANDVAVALLTSELAFLSLNPTMARFAGRSEADLLNSALRETFPELNAFAFEVASQIVSGECGAEEREVVLRAADQELRVQVGLYGACLTAGSLDAIQMVIRTAPPPRDETRELLHRLQFEELITEISGSLASLPPDEIDGAIQGAIRRMVDHLELDRSTLFEVLPHSNEVHTRYSYSRPGVKQAPMIRTDNLFPWMWSRLSNNEIVSLSDPDEIPADAVTDRQWMELIGPSAIVVMPIHLGGRLAYLFTLESFSPVQKWPPELLPRQRLAGELIGMAAARKRTYFELKQRLEFERTLREISSLFVNPCANQFDEDVEVALRLLVELTNTDRASIGIFSSTLESISIRHAYSKQGIPQASITVTRDTVPWFAAKMLERHRICLSSIDDVEPKALREIETICAEGVRLYMALPLLLHDKVLGFLGLATFERDTEFGAEMITSLEVAASVMANSIARRDADLELAALQKELKNENLLLRENVASYLEHEMLVGSSPRMRDIMIRVAQVGPTKATVLITGETGTGKELLAKVIHDASDRARKTMVKVNCAALPSTLIESELFGREQGAYTGAMTRQVGRFELAHGSTLFLDEIGDLSTELQAKLLRVLQEGEFERLGSSKSIRVDVRVIAATNRDLSKAVREGTFREDLYYRLGVFPIALPPLRERSDDIPQLVWQFVKELGRTMGKAIESIPRKDMTSLQQYPWPGNIRELRNVVEHAMIVSNGAVLRIAPPDTGAIGLESDALSLDESVSEHILQVLKRTQWRVKGPGGAAQILGLHPATLRSKMKKLGIERPTV